ncbi:MAG: crosslink repair DNA glycosylase YcaQ family protein, partial [Acidobacteriaceae bacterium]
AINDLAGEQLARAHHGSLAAAQRAEIEQLLKAGQLRALVCTSSLELGIDMGAIDMVIQVEAPPSVASALQRIGRAGHQVGAPSTGIIFPKYRADLIACAAATQAMHLGLVESTRFLRNPLDILAQQIVAIVAHPPLPPEQAALATADTSPGISHSALLALIRSSAPFATLSTNAFNGVLDMLSGLYPSDEFAELRPRVTWDRTNHWLTPRHGSKRVAILNGGTIPDRGLYGVFLANSPKPVRVGELDEEMVFEARAGEVFLLGASSWRIDQITHDRVLVTPAPGQPGKLPFWHGDRAGRPIEFGRRIGQLVRELRSMSKGAAIAKLTHEHDLDLQAAENVLRYITDQELATGEVPDDRTILIERVRDELGDWRVCVLTPFGSRIHAPWAMAAAANAEAAGLHAETMWTDDGFVLRFPDTDQPPDANLILLDPHQAANLVTQQLGHTPLFAGRFREAAARALLLPRRRAEGRAPLWQQRKRASDLLGVATRYPGFPILLETFRECLRDVFDMPALFETLAAIKIQSITVQISESQTPSPFAGAVLFGYVANFIYDGDAPVAERRAQALSIDQDQLRELLGDSDLRELLNEEAIRTTEEQLQCLTEERKARNPDGIHDLLLRLGELSREELAARCEPPSAVASIDELARAERVLEIQLAGTQRFIAAEDASLFRDLLPVSISSRLPKTFLDRSHEPLLEIVRRYARTHGPFTTIDIASRFGFVRSEVEQVLQQLAGTGRIIEGGFTPGGLAREWIDVEVLRSIRKKSLAKLRNEIEPVEPPVFAQFLSMWQGVIQPRRGLDALLDVIETLQGAPLAASALETEIFPARISGYQPSDLDKLIAAGEVVWVGIDSLGDRNGRIGLYLTEKLPLLWAPKTSNIAADIDGKSKTIIEYLQKNGASFFQPIHEGVGGGYPGETLDALWSLAWQGLLINDAFHALRAYCERAGVADRKQRTSPRTQTQQGFRSRRTTPPAGQGRWSLNASALDDSRTALTRSVEWNRAISQQLLARYGIVFRETVLFENIPGGFPAIYVILKALEESGRVRRGYFISKLGGSQFALPPAVESLRSLRTEGRVAEDQVVILAATDPANPYGALVRWPSIAEAGSMMSRTVGAQVVLIGGHLRAYLRHGNPAIQVLLPEEEPDRSRVARLLAKFLAEYGRREVQAVGLRKRSGMLIKVVNGIPIHKHWIAKILQEAGFRSSPIGFNLQRISIASQDELVRSHDPM